MTRLGTNNLRAMVCGALMIALGVITYAQQTLRIVPIVHDNQVLVSFDVPDGYTSDVRDAIASGLRTTFSYDVQLKMHVTMWADVTVATSVVSVSDKYDNLTRRHTLIRTVDGREQDSITTENEATVRQWLTALDKLAICNTTKLVPNREYYVYVSAKVPTQASFLGRTTAMFGRSPFTFIPN
jgi:hypothetical protein